MASGTVVGARQLGLELVQNAQRGSFTSQERGLPACVVTFQQWPLGSEQAFVKENSKHGVGPTHLSGRQWSKCVQDTAFLAQAIVQSQGEDKKCFVQNRLWCLGKWEQWLSVSMEGLDPDE